MAMDSRVCDLAGDWSASVARMLPNGDRAEAHVGAHRPEPVRGAPPSLDYGEYRDRIRACWLGKSIGGAIGARMENQKTRLALDREKLWPETVVPNDDMDIQLVWLEALQERGPWLGSDDLVEFWQDRCWYNFAEYGVFLNNVQRGIRPPLSGTWNNRFFFESEGCPIRSEIWGLVCPGNPELAAEYARRDAQLDHGGASVLCEMFLSAAAAAAFFDPNPDRAIDAGLAVLPGGSAVHRMVEQVRTICAAHPRFEDAWRLVVRRFGDRDASKAIMNQAIVVMALTLGRGDFAETIRLAVNSGWDTDCTAATAGALLGILKGSAALPRDWEAKLGATLTCGIAVKHRNASFEQLAEDTARAGVEIARTRNAAVAIAGAPEVPLRTPPAPDIRLDAAYPEGPVLRAARPTPVRLRFHNDSPRPRTGSWSLEPAAHVVCSTVDGTLDLAPGETREVEVLVSARPGVLWDKNPLALQWRDHDGTAGRLFRFGLGGARLWRIYGPYWDMWDTTKHPVCPYHHDDFLSMPHGGDSWNQYARLDRRYLDEDRLLREDLPEELPETLEAGEDYLDGADLAGFRGQACFYLVREIVAARPCKVNFHLTSSAPLAAWFDGREIARRERGPEVSPQDGWIEAVDVDSTPRRLVVKLARQGDALSFCLTAMAGQADPDRIRGISVFADLLGDLPMMETGKGSAGGRP